MSEENTGNTFTGSVARFDSRRGYGFLSPDDGGEDVFVHQNNIVMEGFRFLNPGEKVRFGVEEGERGRKALAVSLLEPRPEREQRAGEEARDQQASRHHGHGNDEEPSASAGSSRRSSQRRSSGRHQSNRREQSQVESVDVSELERKFDKLSRRHERLLNLLVEKEILAPGEIDELPGLEEVTGCAVDIMTPEFLSEQETEEAAE